MAPHSPRDRYVGYEAGAAAGRLLTIARRLEHPPHLTVNAKVNPADGELRVRIVDQAGQPFAGFDWADSTPIKGDRVNHPVRWSGDPLRLTGKEVRFEFRLKQAALFAFEVH